MLPRILRGQEYESNNHLGTEVCQKCGGILYEKEEHLQERYTDLLFFKIL